MANYAPTILVDFDGVIHRYSQGWADGTAYDPPVEGAKKALETLEAAGYIVVIFTTRDRDQVRKWLNLHNFEPYDVTNEKRMAICLIDDRAIRFENWDQTIFDFLRLYSTDKQGS